MTFLQSGSSHYRHWLFTAALIFVLSCSEKNDPGPPAKEDNLIEASISGSRSAAELQLLVELSGQDIDPAILAYDVEVYSVIYTTTYQDTEIDASGLVILPKTTTAVPMISFQRGTVVKQSDAPSMKSGTSEAVISYAALASMGFIAVVPDLIGFGESKEIFHPYYIEDPTAIAVIDLLRAAATLAEEKEMEFSRSLFLAGYSQGGYATLATHKALESNGNDTFELVASFPGAGGYDITSLKEYFFSQETYDDPHYLAYVAMSYQSYYGQNDLVENLFNAPYAERIPTLFDGLHSQSDIDAQLTNDVSALVKEAVLNGTAGNALTGFLQEKFAENSLVDWVPQVPVFLYHGDADVTVPYQNSQITYETLIANGTSVNNLQLITLQGKDHNTALEPYVVDLIKKLNEMK